MFRFPIQHLKITIAMSRLTPKPTPCGNVGTRQLAGSKNQPLTLGDRSPPGRRGRAHRSDVGQVAIWSHRRGFTLVEMIGTCLLLGVLFAITVPMLVLVARERHSTEQRQFALQHAANLLEQSAMRDWAELDSGELSLSDADSDLQAMLPGLERSLVVTPGENDLESRQITATVRWRNRAGDLVAPLRLSAWVYPTKEVP